MFAVQAPGFIRASTQASSSACAVICTARRTSCLALSNRPAQRRPSSSNSKASCPPSDRTKGARPAATAAKQSHSTAKPPAQPLPSTKHSKSKKERHALWQAAKSGKREHDLAYQKLPRVPSTDNMRPNDLSLSAFFSLHRPLSLHKPIPPSASQESFDRIFESAMQKPSSPSDVIQTLNSAIDAFDPAAESGQAHSAEMQWEIAVKPRTVDDMVSQMQPHQTPPAPEGHSSSTAAKGSHSKSRQLSRQSASDTETTPGERNFTTTIFLHETTGDDGSKSYYAHSTPVIQIDPIDSVAAHTQAQVSENRKIVEIKDQRQPFLERMRRRQERYVEYVERKTILQHQEQEVPTMHAISVKRQRKLKMKKHKYKKLMRKTRNLRRRLDRN